MSASSPRPPSLERRLPLVMSGVLAGVLVAVLAVTYLTLARSAIDRAEDRMARATRQLASVAEVGLRQARIRYQGVASDGAVRRALREADAGPLRAPTDSLVRAALARASTPTDSGMPVELWTADGRRVAFVGDDLGTGADVAPREPVLAESQRFPVLRPGLTTVGPRDSLALGTLYAEGGRVHFWIVAPVIERGTHVGYLAHQRRIAAGPQAERTLRELSGDSVVGYYRTRDGRFWSTLAGVPTTATEVDSSRARVVRTRRGVGEVLSAEAEIAGTPLALVFELPRRRALAAPRAAVLRLGGVSVALFGLAVRGTWGLSRRITRPIASLTAAAEAIARGDYGARAQATGNDEVARLAASFNRMAAEIADARRVLERQSSEARATADALARSNTELEAAREAAETASRAKSDFLATMSHELRTPLNAIGGYTELLEMELRGPLTDAQRRDLARIRVSQQHLLGLIGGVLDMSRIEHGTVTYQLVSVPLAPFLAGLDGLVAPQAASRELSLESVPCDPELAAVADREKLRQILLNLLSNAIRATPPGGAVTLDARARDATTVEIRVRDTGIGIPGDKQAQIFEPFVQLDRSITRVRDGVGLGLAISRDLARGMGGDLTVESRVNHGSCFTLALPRGVASDGVEITGESPVARAGS